MTINLELALVKLVESAARFPAVRAIGLSGGDRPLPQPGGGDIDLFMYCVQIPDLAQRRQLLAALPDWVEQIEVGRFAGGYWGQGDRCLIGGIESWLMYFTVDQAQTELAELLDGKYLGRVDHEYYPLARCAMWKTMRALYDPDGLLGGFRTRLVSYPPGLARSVVEYHLAKLQDVEDLERAVHRKDVFFYHYAFDLALDHFLQALFALNQTFFPGRKRSEEFLLAFLIKPLDCLPRIRQAIASGADAATLEKSYQVWQDLVQEIIPGD
jgi:hypothetical protein